MKATRLLPIVALFAAVAVGLALWFLQASAGGDAAGGVASGSRPSAAPSVRSEGVSEPEAPVVESTAASAAGRTSAGASSQARTIAVRVRMPLDAPADPELAVVALDGASLSDTDVRARLEELRRADESTAVESASPVRALPVRALPVRALVDGAGRAQLALPPELAEPTLVLDGRFLFVEEPLRLAAGAQSATLEAQLGACLIVRPETGSSAFALDEVRGGVRILGGSFGAGGGGFQGRELALAGAAPLEARALDTRLTWSVFAELEAHHGPMRLGLELAPGEERQLAYPITLGGRVRGIAVDEAGEPLAEVDVRASGGGMPWLGGGDGKRTTSAADGRFELSGIAPGEHEVVARLEGRRSARSAQLALEDGTLVDGLRLVLERGASIAGSVRWPDGAPAADTEVVAEAFERSGGFGGWGGGRLQRAGRATTGPEGAFRITGLEDGAFVVRAQRGARGPAAESVSGDAEEAPAPAELRWRTRREGVAAGTEELVLTLAAPIAIAGSVLDDRDEPVAAFTVHAQATHEGGPRERQAFERPDGTFVFERATPGEWRVHVTADLHVASEAQTVVLASGDELPRLAFQLVRGASAAGVVVDPYGSPVPGAAVGRESERSRNVWGGGGRRTVEAAEDGTFLLEELEPGTVELVASAELWADSEPTAFELAPGQRLADARLVLRVGGRIVGAASTPEGEPLSGQRIAWGPNAMAFGARGETRTDASGRFEFEHVTPGSWAVSAAPSMAEMGQRLEAGGSMETVWIELMGGLMTRTVEVADGETVEVYLGGEPKQPVRVHGFVSRAGEPLPGAQVYAVSEGSAVFQGMKSALTATDGSYELVVDRPGAHVVSATMRRNEREVGVEAVVVVPREDSVRVDLAIPLGRIEGEVEEPDGGAAAGVRLSLQREDGLGRVRWNGAQTSTDEAGRYAFEDLEAGRYTVRANSSGWGANGRDAWGIVVRDGVVVEEDTATAGVDFRLERAGAVHGIVRGPNGKGVARATVFFRDAAGRLVSGVSSTATDANGAFEADGLGPGTYTLSVRAQDLAANDAGSVLVASGETAEVELVVESGARLRVELEDADGIPRLARFEVLDGDGREVGGLVTTDELRAAFNEGFSSSERELGPLPLDRYTVRATTTDGAVVEKSVRLRAGDAPKLVQLVLED